MRDIFNKINLYRWLGAMFIVGAFNSGNLVFQIINPYAEALSKAQYFDLGVNVVTMLVTFKLLYKNEND